MIDMKKLFVFAALVGCIAAHAQVTIPKIGSEDTQGVMSKAYWEMWNDSEQARIDADIEANRKADAVFTTGKVKKGTTVKVEQIRSSFAFGASSFNWDQLGSTESNAKYRNLFGTLFNRATVPFYWRNFEPIPGKPRYQAGVGDTEEWWNQATNHLLQVHWRRPPTDPIVNWCEEHDVDVHGHTLVWGNRKYHYPTWLQFEGIPENERRILDTLETVLFATCAITPPSYEKMTPEEVAATVPTYLRVLEQRNYDRISDIMGHYAGRIDSWDVVNESAKDFSNGVQDPSLPMCKSFYGMMFSDYTYKAFKKAEECNTWGSLLNINDFATGDHYLEQVKDLLNRGAKIDVVGSQMHLFSQQAAINIAAGKHVSNKVEPAFVREFFSKFADLGLPTCISEITICSASEDERGEMVQAIIARNLYRLWFSLPSMMGITWWNLVDGCSASGEPSISGLFHRDMSPKISFYALDGLLNHEWRTNLEVKPDKKGKISWRGFKGKYKITWTKPNGTVVSEIYELN